MYVTRRLLRSTLPADESVASSSSAVEEPKPATRSTRHSSSSNSSKAKSPKKKASTPRSQSKTAQTDTPEGSADDRSALHGFGLLVDALSADKWCEARILDLDPAKKTAFIHYMGWNSRYDAWVDVAQLTPHRRHTKGVVKKGASWTGKRSLFHGAKSNSSTEIKAEVNRAEETKAPCEVATPKVEEEAVEAPPAKPKRPTSTRKASPVARKKYNRVSSSSSEEEEEEEDGSNSAKTRAKARGSDSRERKKPRRVVERAIQRGVQVVVETLGEDRERKLRGRSSGNVDLELDVDIRGRFSTSSVSSAGSNDDDDDDGNGENDEDEVPQSKTRSRTPTRSKKRASPRDTRSNSRNTRQRIASNSEEPRTNTESTRPPVDPVDAGIFATKEKLAAIFRLRLHRKQQLMEELSDPNGFSMQDELRRAAAASATTEQPAYSPRTMAANQAYLQHLERQQYCYQQAMLAAGLPTLAGIDNTLYGGIMDPRIIQARMDDLEHQRMLQQQQIQDYYTRVLTIRERNMSALASTTDFLQQAEGTWEKQLGQTIQGGGGDEAKGDEPSQGDPMQQQAQATEPVPEKAVECEAKPAPNEPAAPSKEQPCNSDQPTETGVCSETRPPQQTFLYECAL